jgi:hypothetical protein
MNRIVAERRAGLKRLLLAEAESARDIAKLAHNAAAAAAAAGRHASAGRFRQIAAEVERTTEEAEAILAKWDD